MSDNAHTTSFREEVEDRGADFVEQWALLDGATDEDIGSGAAVKTMIDERESA